MIGILLLSTGKYGRFLQPVVNSIDKFVKHDKSFFIFTDEEARVSSPSAVIQLPIEPYKFPLITLYRYKIFNHYKEELKDCTHLLYMDVDMEVVSKIENEILVDGLLAVRHPAFFKGGWGSNNNPKESLSYLHEELRFDYHCGGVQGGKTGVYLKASEVLADRINSDEQRGIMAEWHDETHWNWLLKQEIFPFTSLSPVYCMVEDLPRRKSWGIDYFEPKIIALNKNHKELRI